MFVVEVTRSFTLLRLGRHEWGYNDYFGGDTDKTAKVDYGERRYGRLMIFLLILENNLLLLYLFLLSLQCISVPLPKASCRVIGRLQEGK